MSRFYMKFRRKKGGRVARGLIEIFPIYYNSKKSPPRRVENKIAFAAKNCKS